MPPRPTFLFLALLTALCLTPLLAQEQQSAKALTNADVIRMVQAGLSDEVIVSAIQANPTQLEVSVDALLALKKAGASDKVLAAVLAAHSGSKTGTNSLPASGPAPASPPSSRLGGPGEMMEGWQQMPPQVQAMMASMGMGTMPGMSPGAGLATQMPHVTWTVAQQKRELPVSMAQVAQTKMKGGGSAGGSMLQGLASQALSFAAIGAGPGAIVAAPVMGMAGGIIPGMGRGSPSITYVWALPGRHSSTVAASSQPRFEINYADIVGIDPDDYEPALVNLVQTKDNWRLVGASKTKMKDMGAGYPQGAISEQRLPARMQKIASGQVQIEPSQPLGSGEYAVVLHPLHKKHKGSLGGGSEAQVFYSVWDFSVPEQSGSTSGKK